MTIRNALLDGALSFTPSEEKIARVLLNDYPSAGLGPATALARRAGVSDPTVGRLAVKLGFEGYPKLQQALLEEVEDRLHSPLLMMEAKRLSAADGTGAAISTYFGSVMDSLEKAASAVPPQTYERAAKLVMDKRRRVSLLGGRFSGFIAGMLAGYLTQMRPGIEHIGPLTPASFDRLVDIGRGDTLVVFDFRRYQNDVIAFSRAAAQQGATIIVFTDPWCSPVSEVAEVTLMTPVGSASPFDTMAPIVAQVEAFANLILSSLSESERKRVEALETLRRAHAVTVDAADTASRASGRAGPSAN